MSAQLGTVSQGPEISHTFLVRNTGDQPVTFQAPAQVNYPCCMEARLSSESIPVKGQAELTITYKTRTRPGPFDLFVRVFPSGGDIVEQYHLSGQVTKSFVIKPKALDLKTERRQTFEVSGDQMGKTFSVAEVKSNSPHLQVERSSTAEDSQVYTVTWDGQPVQEKVPVVYVITDSETFGWAPVLIKGVTAR
jgi:Protein of unknown function (DUF1573)